jgi:hypothetical protein
VIDESDGLLATLEGTAGNDVTVVGVLRVRARALLELGSVEEAAATLRRAISMAEHLDGGYELGLCLDAYADVERVMSGGRMDREGSDNIVFGAVGAT